MANMSYCKFQNTLTDLRDCEGSMDDGDLSKEERRARDKMIKLCVRIANTYYDEETDEVNPPDGVTNVELDEDD